MSVTELGIDSAVFVAALSGASDAERNSLLDAARAEFIKHGFRRTSPVDVARAAKVSRATLYRKLGDKDAIVTAVVIRDVLRFFESIQEDVLPLTSPVERVTEAFVLGMREARSHALVLAILEHEPETFARLLSTVNRPPMTLARDTIAGVLADETLTLDDAATVADILVRITTTLLLAPSDIAPLDTDDKARDFARTYLGAMVAAAGK